MYEIRTYPNQLNLFTRFLNSLVFSAAFGNVVSRKHTVIGLNYVLKYYFGFSELTTWHFEDDPICKSKKKSYKQEFRAGAFVSPLDVANGLQKQRF